MIVKMTHFPIHLKPANKWLNLRVAISKKKLLI